jgi:hypothetical protein
LKFGSTATLSNAGVLNLPTGGTFENATTGTLTIPTINLTGGTLSGNQGFSSPATSGYGTIAASLLNTGSLTATGSGHTLTVSGATSGSTGDVNAGATSTDTAKLDLQNDLSAHNFTLNQAASVNVAPGKTINLTGNFYNNSQTGANWGPAGGFNLSMGTGTFELAGRDYGAVLAGFSDNFNLANLNVTGTLTLVDEINNGNRGGAHSGAEALYISSLSGDGTLDVNGFWCYVLVDNTPILLLNGTYGGVTIIGDPPPSSPVPVPASALLLGSGLLALGLLRFGRR